MKHLVALKFVFSLLHIAAAGSTIPSYFRPVTVTPRDLSSAQVQRDLGCRLSNTTTIIGATSNDFTAATVRWSNFHQPTIQIVVEPGKESDVSKIVKYCDENSIDFLVYNRGYAFTKTFGDFNGLQINMNKLNGIRVQPDGKSAWFQAGTYGNQITDFLWDRGYVTTTAAAQCISLLGPGLGGGHGSHQGSIGMISDNFLQLNVVLANGSTVRVNSKSHSDLLWGLKGAGHNFGIVTSVEMGIYPRGPSTWYYHNYVWRGDKLLDVFNAINKLGGYGTLPLKMAVNYGTFLMNSSISTEEPVILWTFSYAGSAEEAVPYFAPFNAIESVWEESGETPYPKISTAQSNGINSPLCEKYAVDKIITTAGLQIYNLTTEQEIWEGFKRRAISNPDLANAVFIIHEGYSNQAVAKHNPADSAYAFRDDYHLMMFQGTTDNSTLKDDIWKWGREVKDLWNAGQPGRPVNSYVNYANGFEGPKEWYGHEVWRQKRLRALKAKYDPYNRFRFYNPIV